MCKKYVESTNTAFMMIDSAEIKKFIKVVVRLWFKLKFIVMKTKRGYFLSILNFINILNFQ